MTFFAGAIDTGKPLTLSLKQNFLAAVEKTTRDFPWPSENRQADNYMLSRSGFTHMWQGPKLAVESGYDAVATGVQWRKIPNHVSGIEYLRERLSEEKGTVGNYFDCFSCAIIDTNGQSALVATDPLGTSPVFYMIDKGALIFSSHQVFFRFYLGQSAKINWQGILEYLIIGHNMGSRTLLQDVSVLRPGQMIRVCGDSLHIDQYEEFDNVSINKTMSVNDASDMLYSHIMEKCAAYKDLAQKPFVIFLSGGWDSRLIASVLASTGKVALTYTTQQQSMTWGEYLISEKKIAREVADYLGLSNEFEDSANLSLDLWCEHAKRMDFTTWFHRWGLLMAERIPYDQYVLFDGFSGGLHMREPFITPTLFECIRAGDRKRAVEILYSLYLNGVTDYTPSIDTWRALIHPEYIEQLSCELYRDIAEEISRIRSENFVTPFIARNRECRGITASPRLGFGRKGAVMLPFGDFEFARKALSIPIEFKVDLSLHQALLERSKPGLSKIVSTNTSEFDKIKAYLEYPPYQDLWFAKIKQGARKNLPMLFQGARKMADMIHPARRKVKRTTEGAPVQFMEVLSPRLTQAVIKKDLTSFDHYRHFLAKMATLSRFLDGEL